MQKIRLTVSFNYNARQTVRALREPCIGRYSAPRSFSLSLLAKTDHVVQSLTGTVRQ